MDKRKTPLVLALDFGSSSIRAVLFDQEAEPVSGLEAHSAYHIPTRTGGVVEVDADLLLESAWRCLDELTAKAGEVAGEVIGVGVCTFVTNIMGLDSDWKAVSPLVLYSDTRPELAVDQIRARIDEEAYHQRCGAPLHTSYWPARLWWWAQAEPDVFCKVKHWITLGDFLALRLFGRSAVSYSAASWTGMLNRSSLTWDGELLKVLPVIPEAFSPLVDINQPLCGLQPEFARRWPWLKDIPWLPAVGDGASANLGSGCATERQVAVTVGTTSAVRAVITGTLPSVPEGLWCYRVDQKRSLLGGAMTEGGSLFAWLTQTLNWSGTSDFESALTAIPADSHGLTFLPLLGGERSPGWIIGARGAVMGLSFATSPPDLLRAGLEGVTYRIAMIYERLRQALPGEPAVVACGGAILHSPAWLQMLADVLGLPVHQARVTETSARGTALLVLEVLGQLAHGVEENGFIEQAVEPDEIKHKIYRQAMIRQQAMYARLVKERI